MTEPIFRRGQTVFYGWDASTRRVLSAHWDSEMNEWWYRLGYDQGRDACAAWEKELELA